jgi:hypothetical protein
MRVRFVLCNTALLFFVALPIGARAQFQDPTPDELKMTSDPKAPGAAAVYLYREETLSCDRGEQTYYARIKVLTEKGKELATVQIPYNPESTKVDRVEARTIHADGKVIPLSVKPDDLVSFKNKYHREDTLVFTLPDVEVGSILEYRLRLRAAFGIYAPRWDLQTSYPIRKEHLVFAPYSSIQGPLLGPHGKALTRLVATQTHNAPVSIQIVNKQFIVDLNDVPSIPDEDWMPPINTIRWRVDFYYTYAATEKEFWDTEAKFWAADISSFIKVTGTLRKAADSLVSPGDTDEQKARKIYAAVLKLENTDFTRERTEAERKKEKLKEIHSVDDVWKNQSGPGNSIALLYVALAQAAGLKAWPMWVVDRSNATFDYSYLSKYQLDDYIAIVEISGKEVYLDPGQKVCPFGVLHWMHALTDGFRESDHGPEVTSTPSLTSADNHVWRNAELTVNTDGTVTGTARITMNGADAIYWRQVALENDENELKKKFGDSLDGDLPDGVTPTFDRFIGLEDSESNLTAILKLSGNLGTPAGKRLLLPGLIFDARAKHPFVSEDKRTIPVDVDYPRMETDDVTFHLPMGYPVESVPRTPDINWPGIAALRINSESKDQNLEVVRVFSRNFTVLPATDYDDLHNFYLKLATADQQQIVLSRANSAKGN